MRNIIVLVRSDEDLSIVEDLLDDILFRHCRRRGIVPIIREWDGSIASIPKDHRVVIYTDGAFEPDSNVAEFCFWQSHVLLYDEQLVLRNGELLAGPEAEYDIRHLLSAA